MDRNGASFRLLVDFYKLNLVTWREQEDTDRGAHIFHRCHSTQSYASPEVHGTSENYYLQGFYYL